MHNTTDTTAIYKRKWTTTKAKIEGSHVTAKTAPANATVRFVIVQDERGATVSSRVALFKKAGK